MLNATIRNGKLNGELNGDNGKVDGELNPALLYLNKSLLYIPFYHIFLERDKIKNVWIFHCLYGKLTLRRSKSAFKV